MFDDEDQELSYKDLFIPPRGFRSSSNRNISALNLKGHSSSFLQRGSSRCDGQKEISSTFHVTPSTCNAATQASSRNASDKFGLTSRHYDHRLPIKGQENIQARYATCRSKYGRLSSLSFNTFDHRLGRANSISNCSNDSQTASLDSSPEQQPHSFTNMIAKLASSTSVTQKSSGAVATSAYTGQATTNGAMAAAALRASGNVPPLSATQSKRKRSKLLDLLLNTNWSKQSQQASHLMKLDKVLLFCDPNFLDEKTGESPLSLAITSTQINELQTAATSKSTSSSGRSRLLGSSRGQASGSSGLGCPQSTSLFDLQNQHPTTSHSQATLRQTSSVEISQSKGPLVERILLLLIKSGAMIDFRNSDGRTPLHVAATKSNFWALKTLLDLGASIESRDTNGLTPLFLSVLHKAELKVTQLLLNHISQSASSLPAAEKNGTATEGGIGGIGISDQHGWQAIHYAAKYGLSGHIEKLLYYGCDINAKISGSGNTPLHVAAINDQLQVAQVLLLRGADRAITNNSHQNAHQVAVISNNMDLAEFIASHDETKVVPFAADRPKSSVAGRPQAYASNRSSISSSAQQSLVKSDSSTFDNISASNSHANQKMRIVQPQPQEAHQKLQLDLKQQQQQQQQLNPLVLDVANNYAGIVSGSAPTTNTSGTSHHTGRSSLLSIDTTHSSLQHSQQLNVQVSNISPCLSQRSCATSNTTTTSSSGVCCDADGHNSEDTNGGAKPESCRSNVTIISIANNQSAATAARHNCGTINGPPNQYSQHQLHHHHQHQPATTNEPGGIVSTFANGVACATASSFNSIDRQASSWQPGSVRQLNGQESANEEDTGNQSGSESSSSSSSDGLYSLMSDKKPLYVGSMVKATNCYESGDPKHLQLRREDLIEILECPVDLVQDGQLPRLANKPMLYGRRQSDGACGLFPSFCVRRSKQKLPPGPRHPMLDVTNLSGQRPQQTLPADSASPANEHRQQPGLAVTRAAKLPESQSMAALGVAARSQQESPLNSNRDGQQQQESPRVTFREFRVTLDKVNEGFGFVLRGARIDPSTLSAQSKGDGKISIDESLMAANKLASLQYFSDIELNSIAHQNGLRRGDFLVSVNSQDVRLCSHEQVVQMIRQSGDRVHLTIARAEPIAPISASVKTLTRVKPEPPKRDPSTTLTRNKASRIKSMFVVPQQNQQAFMRQLGDRFDADKPLPQTPNMISSPLSSLNRSVSTNLSHFNSANSLSSAAPDSQSITSISTVESGQIAPNSSSSTTTLTTVATTKPKPAPKPSDLQPRAPQAMCNGFAPQPAAYQPAAVITTNKRQSQDQCSPLAHQASSDSVSKQASASKAPIPPPPPPPPPMPNFATTPVDSARLSQRRESAPASNAPPMIKIDRNQLLKKRDSLASVVVESVAAASAGAAPICTVAAACAAAANNRLQRQQQRQQQGLERDEGKENKCEESAERVSETSTPISQVQGAKTSHQVSETLGVSPIASDTQGAKVAQADLGEKKRPGEQPRKLESDQVNNKYLVTNSATLGRKSSAQIIQQPKPNSSASHSQTMKMVTTKRMSILDHDIFPSPATPSLPPPPMFAEHSNDDSEVIEPKLVAHHHQQPQRGHAPTHHRHGSNQQHALIEPHRELDRQQLLYQMQAQNQQQMILHQQQQLRQQQQMQERLRLQQLQQQRQQQQHQKCPHHPHRVSHNQAAQTLGRPKAPLEGSQYGHMQQSHGTCRHHSSTYEASGEMMTTPAMTQQCQQHYHDQHHTLPNHHHHHNQQHQSHHNRHNHHNSHHQPQLVSGDSPAISAHQAPTSHHQHDSRHHNQQQRHQLLQMHQPQAHYQQQQQQQQQLYMQLLDPRVASNLR